MKSIRMLLILAGVLLLVQEASAQTPETVYRRFRVTTTAGKEFKGNDGVLRGDSLIGVTRRGEHLGLLRNHIAYLEYQTGHNARAGALYGAGAGFLTAMLAWVSAEAEASENSNVEVNYGAVPPLIVGLTAGGALIGYIIGASLPTWQPVPATRIHTGLSPDGGAVVLTIAF
jgi:hypothetical protein